MSVKNKRGITVSSLVLYVVLFFGITTFISILYTNMNETLFNNRGVALNYTALNKLEYNLVKSSNSSNNITIKNDVIEFSNGDKYYYADDKDMIILNNGVLCTSVAAFEPNLNEVNGTKKLQINVTFNKYLAILNREVIVVVEV